MKIIEIKKDSKKVEINKDFIIIVLSIGLIIVSTILIHSNLQESVNSFCNEREMGQYQQIGKYIDEQNNQNTPVNQIDKVSLKTTPTSSDINLKNR